MKRKSVRSNRLLLTALLIALVCLGIAIVLNQAFFKAANADVVGDSINNCPPSYFPNTPLTTPDDKPSPTSSSDAQSMLLPRSDNRSVSLIDRTLGIETATAATASKPDRIVNAIIALYNLHAKTGPVDCARQVSRALNQSGVIFTHQQIDKTYDLYAKLMQSGFGQVAPNGSDGYGISRPIAIKDAAKSVKPGDIIFFSKTGALYRLNHVGIVINVNIKTGVVYGIDNSSLQQRLAQRPISIPLGSDGYIRIVRVK